MGSDSGESADETERARIVDIAAELFADLGYMGTKLPLVAAAAGRPPTSSGG